MHTIVNGTRIWFDVEGAGLVPDGPVMRERPTLVLLHGGPGFDHSSFKPAHSVLTDVAQIIYVDHRGNGRSAYNDPAHWTLDQWADDLRALFETLGIEKPVVLGLSFGGFVAQSLALRHPNHIGKLVLSSTAAKFRLDRCLDTFLKLHGTRAREIAEAFWTDAGNPDKVTGFPVQAGIRGLKTFTIDGLRRTPWGSASTGAGTNGGGGALGNSPATPRHKVGRP
jgi:pimeloyl-ACP methyl ester carboxylesterase